MTKLEATNAITRISLSLFNFYVELLRYKPQTRIRAKLMEQYGLPEDLSIFQVLGYHLEKGKFGRLYVVAE